MGTVTGGARNIVTNGLVLNLDAANYKSYPGSGTTWTDLSPSNNTGTLTNGPTFSSLNCGSIVFDGADDLVTCGSAPMYTTTPDNTTWTISSFFKASGSYNHALVTRFQYNGVYAAGFNLNKTPLLYVNPYWVMYGSRNIADNTVHQLTFTYQSVQITQGTGSVTASIYIDGLLDTVGSSIVTTWGMQNELNIGYQQDGASRRLNGNIYNIQIYNRVLSATEIRQNFNSSRARFGI